MYLMNIMKDCVFCKIVAGEIPCEKLFENEDFIAFLSITPVYDGLTLVIPKKHYGSYVYKSMPDSELCKFHLYAKEVALKLDKSLWAERIIQVMEGLGVDHAHIKLYPKYKGVLHAIVEKETPVAIGDLKKVSKKIREGK